MSQTLTDRTKAIKNTPGTGELAQVSELNSNFDKFDNHYIPAAKITRATTQSITTATTTEIDFTATQYDSYAARSEGAIVNLTNNEFVCRKAGLYWVEASNVWNANATGYRSLRMNKNGAIQAVDYVIGSSAASVVTKVGKPLVLAVNDIIDFTVFQNSGAGLNIDTDGFPDGISASFTWLGNVVEV